MIFAWRGVTTISSAPKGFWFPANGRVSRAWFACPLNNFYSDCLIVSEEKFLFIIKNPKFVKMYFKIVSLSHDRWRFQQKITQSKEI